MVHPDIHTVMASLGSFSGLSQHTLLALAVPSLKAQKPQWPERICHLSRLEKNSTMESH